VKTYTIRFARSAEKELSQLPSATVERIRLAIQGLATQPRPTNSKKLKGLDNAYRLRVGDYRVLYEVHDDLVLVLVVRVRHRKDAYQ
jgi:mRNA interferase RelE/StbE